MLEILKPYILTFIPIFVAVDALGNVPLFLSLTSELNNEQRKKIIVESVATATITALVFMFIGKFVLRLMGITVSDFKIAGGILLLVISVSLLLPGRSKAIFKTESDQDIGIFPLGTPLVTGPAVLTTTLMMIDSFGMVPTFVSLAVNMFIVWIMFLRSDIVMRILGEAGARAFSKVADILLASIAVMMIRRGILEVFLIK
ncbi:MAG: MarC family protein [Candidatus Omnitrophota bacterium]